MDAKLRQHIERALSIVDEATRGPRLLDDARRLWGRIGLLLSMGLIGESANLMALELACFALQLPLRHPKALPPGKLGRTNLRERSEQSAEMLVSQFATFVDEALLDETTRLLLDFPQRTPKTDSGRLLADAVNLEDFGVAGMFAGAIVLGRQGGGVLQVHEGCEKREQYGYWEARLKEGFHFEPVRAMAKRRVENARRVCRLLSEELKEDKAS